MHLSALHDLNEQAAVAGAGIPCRENDAEMWFAESPSDVEFAKCFSNSFSLLRRCNDRGIGGLGDRCLIELLRR